MADSCNMCSHWRAEIDIYNVSNILRKYIFYLLLTKSIIVSYIYKSNFCMFGQNHEYPSINTALEMTTKPNINNITQENIDMIFIVNTISQFFNFLWIFPLGRQKFVKYLFSNELVLILIVKVQSDFSLLIKLGLLL